MTLNKFQQAIGHGRGSNPGPCEAWENGSEVVAAVKGVFELGEVTGRVLCTDRAIRFSHSGIDSAVSGVELLKCWAFRGSPSQADFDNRVATCKTRDVGDGGAAEASDAPELQANGFVLWHGFDDGEIWHLAGDTEAALAARAFAADVGVINLGVPRQPFGVVAIEHDLGELVLDPPGHGLHRPETPTEVESGDPVLRLGQMIEGQKPDPQFQLTQGEDRPGDQRGLFMAGAILTEPALLDLALQRSAAYRTDEPIRPV